MNRIPLAVLQMLTCGTSLSCATLRFGWVNFDAIVEQRTETLLPKITPGTVVLKSQIVR
jgi:hypothetical protein